MSLVVAQVTNDGPRIVSDTRVSFPDGSRSSFKTGTLKAIVVTRKVAICFSGDVDVGLTGVRHFAKFLRGGAAVDDLLTDLIQRTSNSQRYVEFIVASAEASSMLTRIRNGQIERGLSLAWVGDQAAFERFQQERHKSVNGGRLAFMNQLPPAVKVMVELTDAMKAVIEDPAIPSVDDFCVLVAAKQSNFNYLGNSFIHVGRDIIVKTNDNLITKMAHPVEEGGYAVSVVEPEEPGTPALGLSFPLARIGMIYLPLKYDEAQIIMDVSPNDFAKVVLDRFAVAMSDPILRKV